MRLAVSTDLAGLARLSQAVDEFVRAQRLSPPAAYAVMLVAEEAATNVVKYGHPGGDRGELSVTLERQDRVVVLRFSDDGRPFDPTEAALPRLGSSLETRRVGGLGIPLMRRYADAMTYRREGERNVLELRVPV